MEHLFSQVKRYFTNKTTDHDQKIDEGLLKQSIDQGSDKFVFLGENYSISILQNAQLIKPYHKLRYEEVGLYQDCYGRFFIKTHREEIWVEGNNVRKNNTYCFVKTIEQADSLYKSDECLWGVEPYIYESADGIVSVHEQ